MIVAREVGHGKAGDVGDFICSANSGEKLMADEINSGTILIKEGTGLPEGLQCESQPYLKGWRLVKNLSSSGLDRKLCEARWTFFYMAEELSAIVVGSDLEEMKRRAVKRVVASMKSERLNCLEITHVAAKRFLGLPYVTVSGHPRHIQESMFLFQAKRLAEWDQAKLAAA
jgi:hypothetical protein